MKLPEVVDPNKYDVGVIVGRFQIDRLHSGHKELIDFVCENHKKVLIFLGIPRAQGTKRNPLDFPTRQAMIQREYPNIIVMPQQDQLRDEVWSENLDNTLRLVFGDSSALLYGSRDSFIPHYHGRYKTIELDETRELNATEIRDNIGKEVLQSSKFRRGVIYGAYAKRPVTYPTVDICAYNENKEILLARKSNETRYRFVGGFVDRTDDSWETSARREFSEETGCSVHNLRYMFSHQVDDWRYARGEEDGIMTTLFLGKLFAGRVEPKDDIAELRWFDIGYFTNIEKIKNEIEPVHQDMMKKLLEKIYNEELLGDLGDRSFYVKPKEVRDPDAVPPKKYIIE